MQLEHDNGEAYYYGENNQQYMLSLVSSRKTRSLWKYIMYFCKYSVLIYSEILFSIRICQETNITGNSCEIFGKHMETIVYNILICWKWIGTNHKHVLWIKCNSNM